MKRAWNLAPVIQVIQMISEKYWRCLYLSIDQAWWVNELWLKRYSKMHSVSYTDTHHDVTDLLNHGMVKNRKTWISQERNITLLWNKKILNLHLRWHILSKLLFCSGGDLWFHWKIYQSLFKIGATTKANLGND